MYDYGNTDSGFRRTSMITVLYAFEGERGVSHIAGKFITMRAANKCRSDLFDRYDNLKVVRLQYTER